MILKKTFLASLVTLNAIGSGLMANDDKCEMNCRCEHFSWVGREVNGVPGLIIQCKKELPESIQKIFDDSLERWETYLHENHGDFDIETLIKAVSFAATRNDEAQLRHLLGSTMLLWDVGHVRNINVLTASLIRNSAATSDQIEWQFGPEVRRIVDEMKKFPAEQAPTLSLSAQLIILSDRLQSFMEHKHSSDRISLDEQRKVLHGLRGTSDALEQLYESFLDEAAAKN